jgi:hypothetical protein
MTSRKMVENDYETMSPKEISYEEFFVESFDQAVDRTIEDSFVEEDNIFRFVISDVDGVLVEGAYKDRPVGDDLIKLPFVSHLVKPHITEETEESFERLANTFENRIAIATNRDSRVKFFWSSNKVLERIDRLVSSVRGDIPVFEKMQKQLPFLVKDRSFSLVEYIGEKVVRSKNYDKIDEIVLSSIEDVSIVVPNRRTFLKYVAILLKEEMSMNVRVKNYVVV